MGWRAGCIATKAGKGREQAGKKTAPAGGKQGVERLADGQGEAAGGGAQCALGVEDRVKYHWQPNKP